VSSSTRASEFAASLSNFLRNPNQADSWAFVTVAVCIVLLDVVGIIALAYLVVSRSSKSSTAVPATAVAKSPSKKNPEKSAKSEEKASKKSNSKSETTADSNSDSTAKKKEESGTKADSKSESKRKKAK